MSSVHWRLRPITSERLSRSLLEANSNATSWLKRSESLKLSYRWVAKILRSCPRTTRRWYKRRQRWCNNLLCSRRTAMRSRPESDEASKQRKMYKQKSRLSSLSKTRKEMLREVLSKRQRKWSLRTTRSRDYSRSLKQYRVTMPLLKKILEKHVSRYLGLILSLITDRMRLLRIKISKIKPSSRSLTFNSPSL